MKLTEVLRADLDRYVRVLEDRFGADLVSIVLFGSWARGEGRPESAGRRRRSTGCCLGDRRVIVS